MSPSDRLPTYRDGQTCPRCGKGKVHTTDAEQTCSWCGRILWQAPTLVHFCALAEGSQFRHASDPDTLWVKATAAERERLGIHRNMDSYRVDRPGLHAGHGPLAKVVPETARTMRGSRFGYN